MTAFRPVRAADVPWVPIGTHGLMVKTLAKDEETGAMLNYLNIPKDWRGGGVAHFHEAFEEVYILEGSVTLGAGRWFVKGDYFYRPGRVVHGHDEQANEGCRALVRSDGALTLNLVHEPAEPDEYPLEEFDPRGHILQRPVADVPWVRLDGFPPEWEMRELSRDPKTGALTAMARIPAGWSGKGAAHRAPFSLYVLEGALTMTGETLETGDFADGPAGTGPMADCAADGGATLFLWFDAAGEPADA
jgi:quercetin dioxygenase-like cupin family protein